jgi:translation initiation factor 1
MGLVYSTDGGRVRRCPHCGEPLQDGRCPCRAQARRPVGDGILRVRRETGGRRGKTVTTIEGFPGTDRELADLARALKRLCSSGGAVVDGRIEVQGDHRDKVVAHLQAQGHRVKLAGG